MRGKTIVPGHSLIVLCVLLQGACRAGAPLANEAPVESLDRDSLDSSGDGGTPDGGRSTMPVSVAVSKVKNLLTGIAATDDEVARVVADESALQIEVGEWMALPQYREKMLAFFTVSFQQDQWDFADLDIPFCGGTPFYRNAAVMKQNYQQSFARTALALIDEGRPFTETMTTTRFMMTPALMASYATFEAGSVADGYVCKDLFHVERPMGVTFQGTTPTSFSEVLDPASPSYLRFYTPVLATPYPGCDSEIVYPSPIDARTLMQFLYGQTLKSPPGCARPETRTNEYVVASDFSDWRMVQTRLPHDDELPTPFFDLPSMRAGHELVLRAPRVGFYTTLAFFVRWPTNESNQARVLANQALIVGLGQPIDLTNTTHPLSLGALDSSHAPEGTTCYECHQSLDPMRQIYRQSFALYGSAQRNEAQLNLPGQFAFHGVTATSSSVADLGRFMASHPLFAGAWAQRLCTYATSAPCDESDPEFQRLVALFQDSGYSWNRLVQALFASPLVTGLSRSAEAAPEEGLVPVSRREHLCAMLSARLGRADLCALDVNTAPLSPVVQTVMGSWPATQYSRGSSLPALQAQPSLAMRGGMESLCLDLANRFVDHDGASLFQSGSLDAALHRLATNFMGLTTDRAAEPEAVLREHYEAAVQAGVAPTQALRSTFVLACESPQVVSVGQ